MLPSLGSDKCSRFPPSIFNDLMIRDAVENCKFPKMGVPQNGWFIMENPIKMDDLGVPPSLETPKLQVSKKCILCFKDPLISLRIATC